MCVVMATWSQVLHLAAPPAAPPSAGTRERLRIQTEKITQLEAENKVCISAADLKALRLTVCHSLTIYLSNTVLNACLCIVYDLLYRALTNRATKELTYSDTTLVPQRLALEIEECCPDDQTISVLEVWCMVFDDQLHVVA